MTGQFFVVPGINPEPWAIGIASAGRRGGVIKGTMSPNQKLQVFQNALREEVKEYIANHQVLTFSGDMRLRFWFRRQIESGHAAGARRVKTGNYADVTNLQKATEDALQGLLYLNDRSTRDVHSIMLDQGPDVEPMIVVHIQQFFPTMDELTVEAVQLAEFGDTRPRRALADEPDVSPWS